MIPVYNPFMKSLDHGSCGLFNPYLDAGGDLVSRLSSRPHGACYGLLWGPTGILVGLALSQRIIQEDSKVHHDLYLDPKVRIQ